MKKEVGSWNASKEESKLSSLLYFVLFYTLETNNLLFFPSIKSSGMCLFPFSIVASTESQKATGVCVKTYSDIASANW